MPEEVYCSYYNTAGNFVWYGVRTGEHIFQMQNNVDMSYKPRVMMEVHEKIKYLENKLLYPHTKEDGKEIRQKISRLKDWLSRQTPYN